MENKQTSQEKAEQELANKIAPLIKERMELELKRGNGVSLDKNEYIGDRMADIDKEITQLKSKANDQ